jgi:uroporphyrinogen-III synthase
MRVLVLRPEPQASRRAATLEARGFEVTLAPMLTVVPAHDVVASILSPEQPAPDALVFTSAHAVAAIEPDARVGELLEVPAWTVGPGTAAAARAAGFATVTDAGGDARLLLDRLLSDLPENSTLVHVAGRDRAVDIAAVLSAGGRRARTVVAYRAEPVAEIAPAVPRGLAAGSFDIAVLASRRTAEAFRGVLEALDQPLPLRRPALLAISDQAAAPLRDVLMIVRIADAPDADGVTEGVVALAASLPNNETERRS